MSKPEIQTAIILAAGEGSKFWPYNVVRQKCAFPVANVPIVRRLAEDLLQIGMRRLVVVTGAGEGSVRAALHGLQADIRFVRQTEPAGTADAALCGLNDLEEDVLVVAGDLVTDSANIAAVKRQFEAERPMAAVLVQPLDGRSPGDVLVAHVAGDALVGVEGRSRSGEYSLPGIYAFQPKVQQYLKANPGIMLRVPVGGMPPMEAEIAQSLQMMIDDGAGVQVVRATESLVDVDKPWHILQANELCIQAMIRNNEGDVIPESANIHEGAEVHGHVYMGENCSIGNRVVLRGDVWLADGARIDNGAILEGPAVIGKDAIVRDYALIGSHSSLGARGIYGHGAEFTGVALTKVHCYHYCEIWGVVGEAVDFGAATVCGNLRFDDRQTPWRIKGRLEEPTVGANAAYFGDFSRTGVNAIIMPGRRTGVYSCVGAGVVLYDDLPDGELVTVRQELSHRPWGPEKYGW